MAIAKAAKGVAAKKKAQVFVIDCRCVNDLSAVVDAQRVAASSE
jgi:hypothetical protein